MSQQQQNYLLGTDSSLSHFGVGGEGGGLNVFYLSLMLFYCMTSRDASEYRHAVEWINHECFTDIQETV